jgi:hypothetical protein
VAAGTCFSFVISHGPVKRAAGSAARAPQVRASQQQVNSDKRNLDRQRMGQLSNEDLA